MKKRVVVPRLVAVLVGSVLAGGSTGLYAQGPAEPMNYDGAPGGVRYIQEGQPKVLVHPTVDAMEKFRQAQSHQQQGKTPSNRGAKELIYRGGTGGVGVETVPKVYLVFWGSQWSSDPSNEAGLLQRFFADVGASPWQNIVTQYCEGVASGTISCSGTGTPAGNQAGSFLGSWYDNATAAPSQPSQSQLAAEAVRAAQQLGSKAADNVNVQYVIATAHNNNASGFGSSYCAWHSSTSSSNGTLAYTNLPYITDAGASCGANFNGLGANAGITIVEGHEMAETITDPYPSSGWLDSSGEEIGDKCAWISSGPGASTNVLLNGSSYPVQSLWSNASSSCVVQ